MSNASETAMPLGRQTTMLTMPSSTPAHHAASRRNSMPRATNNRPSPAMLPMKCEASTSGKGTCKDSSSVASSVAGVTPETSSIRPMMKV